MAYTRFIIWLRIILPLTALVLLGSLFLLSGNGEISEDSIPFADEELVERLRTQQITQPFYAGITDSGDPITLRAARALPPDENGIARMDQFGAVMNDQERGAAATIAARSGWVDRRRGVAELRGAVNLILSSGYHMTSEALDIYFDATLMETQMPVRGTGPLGDFEAGQLVLRRETTESPLIMQLQNGVVLRYLPSSRN